VFLNRQFLSVFFSIPFATLIAFVNTASADENIDIGSHLAYTPPASAVPTTNTIQVAPSEAKPNASAWVGDSVNIYNHKTLVAPASAEPTTEVTQAPVAKPEQTPPDLWQRIRNGFAMRELNSKLIARHERWYASHPDYVARMSERSQRYLYYITQEVERRGMPSEIALLPIIESAFNPGAYSVGRASGIWQFISSTGKNFGMQQNWWYDGRRDIISATNGALDYLQQLHDQFGDWELALAAYNWGEGAVSRAQARNRKLHKPTNFASLRLPRETQNYVPKLLAVKHIVSDPEHFGLKLASIPNQPYFAAVTTAHPIDVKLAAELADISMEEFAALNPGHNRPVILQDNSTVLLLPVDKLETFQKNLEKNNQRLVSWQPYQTKKGESFDELAPHFGLSAGELRSVNGLSAHAKISSGQTLLVPANNEGPAVETEFAAFNTNLVSIDDTIGKTFNHTVRRGESISIIAHHYHITQARLLELNAGVHKVKVGQRLTVIQGNPRGGNTRLAKARKNRDTKLVRGNKQQRQNITKGSIKIASSR
jgi:membrane-bound lytic murein transglycosylase D